MFLIKTSGVFPRHFTTGVSNLLAGVFFFPISSVPFLVSSANSSSSVIRNYRRGVVFESERRTSHTLSVMAAQEAASIKVGDRCQVAGGRRGEVMFVGLISQLPVGLWVGVKYDEPDGKNDGSVKGVRYFECLDKYGGFVRPDACQCIGNFPKGPYSVSQTDAPPTQPVSKASSLLATPSSRFKTGAADVATPSSQTRDEAVSSSATTRSAPEGGVPHMANRSHVAVYVRERPLSAREVKAGEQNAITLEEAENRIIVEGKKTPFGPYAAVLSPLMNNEDVFKRAVMPLVLVAASGQNASIFCFGHTGAGKTHTVMGYGAELGMYGHAGQALFDMMPKDLRLAVKCAEVYNEKVFDLLGGRVECHVKEDRDGVAQVLSLRACKLSTYMCRYTYVYIYIYIYIHTHTHTHTYIYRRLRKA